MLGSPTKYLQINSCILCGWQHFAGENMPGGAADGGPYLEQIRDTNKERRIAARFGLNQENQAYFMAESGDGPSEFSMSAWEEPRTTTERRQTHLCLLGTCYSMLRLGFNKERFAQH